jgi:hypothetical protein
MDVNADSINALLRNLEQFHKTNLDLIKLKAVDKTADVGSTFVSRAFLIVTISILAMTLTITVSLWLGKLFGEMHYGFLAVSIAYAILAIVLHFYHKAIKGKVANSIVNQFLK